MAVYLVGQGGAVAGGRWELRAGEALLGSAETCLLRLPAVAGVAPTHARLEVTPRSIVLHPLAEGVAVNDQPLTGPVGLRPGDRVGLGPLQLLLETVVAPPAPSPQETLGVALPPPAPSPWRWLLGLLAVVVVVVAGVAAWRLVPPRPAAAPVGLAPETRRRVEAATVWIRCPRPGGESEGSGFVSAPGYVLTNAHVVEGGRQIRVVYDTGTERVRSVEARIVKLGRPGEADDIALLKCPTGQIEPLPLADIGALSEGTLLIAFGFPLGSAVSTSSRGPQISLRRGDLTAVRRNDAGQVEWLESDILAEVGNSGGPVVTAGGQVVGLATMLVGPNLRTARIVPASVLRRFAPNSVR